MTKAEPTLGKPSHSMYAFDSGLSRREFLQGSGLAVLIVSAGIQKPSLAEEVSGVDSDNSNDTLKFTAGQRVTLSAVQQQLFPDDGDGPSARDLQAMSYLEWAVNDPDNRADGDYDFMVRGLGQLDEGSLKSTKKVFVELSGEQQHTLLTQFSETQFGENLMSLLVYYLIEALLLDPVYGGNPEGIGWKWLEHQPGFPQPDAEHRFERYRS